MNYTSFSAQIKSIESQFLKKFHLRPTSVAYQKQPLKVFCKKDVLENFAYFTEKHLCWSHFLIKLQT